MRKLRSVYETFLSFNFSAYTNDYTIRGPQFVIITSAAVEIEGLTSRSGSISTLIS